MNLANWFWVQAQRALAFYVVGVLVVLIGFVFEALFGADTSVGVMLRVALTWPTELVARG